MSLYWYVASKEELLDLMLDAIEAEIEVPEPTGDWRADLGAFAHRTRAALRHTLITPLARPLPPRATPLIWPLLPPIFLALPTSFQQDPPPRIQQNTGRYPHIARLMEAGIDPDDPNTREERFQFSLDCVLDGIAARLAPAG